MEIGGASIIGASLVKPSFAIANDPHYKPETGMKYRRLGRTNLMISEIGLGCASGSLSRQLGPFLFAKWQKEREDVINKLLDLGGNFVTTCTQYHNTIELIGKAIKHRRNEIYLVIGIEPKSKEIMQKELEKALRDLNTDVIDLCFPKGSGDILMAFEMLQKFKDEGKTRSDGDGTEARWIDYTGPLGDEWGGVVIFDHPLNQRYPTPVHIHPKVPYFCFAFTKNEPYTVTPGNTLNLLYRFFIHNGRPNKELNERIANDFVNPPEIEWEPFNLKKHR